MVFIVLDGNDNLNYQLASCYSDVFNGSPFYEDWTISSALDEINFQFKKPGYQGVAFLNGSVRGFAWGYKLPFKNNERTDYEKMSLACQENGMVIENTFYLSEVAILYDEQNKGQGTNLVVELDKLLDKYANVVTRTKNPFLLKVVKKIYGPELFEIAEESSYEGGKAYGFMRNKSF